MFAKLKFYSLLFFIGIICLAIFFIRPYYNFLRYDLHLSLLQLISPKKSIKRIDNQTNILILGIGGGNHDGPNLSDSIIIANYNFTTNEMQTIGIPRDIWSASLQDKINSAYAYGEAKEPGGGLKLAKAQVESLFNIPIEYATVIDFNKFKELIDYLGGVDITIEKKFSDNQYPIEGKEDDLCGGDPDYKCRYETITFQKGPHHMDGTTALKFVRSRHGNNGEGSDFARSKRQQLILAAVKGKIMKKLMSLKIADIKDLYTHVNALIIRDISNEEIMDIAKNMIHKKQNQQNYYLPQDLFEVPNASQYDDKYVLIPQNGDYQLLHQFVNCLLTHDDESACKDLIPNNN